MRIFHKQTTPHIKEDLSSKIYLILIRLLVTVIVLILIYPLYFCVIASFSDPDAVSMGDTILWFKGFTLEAYQNVLKEKSLWIGYRNTIIYTVFGTLYNVCLTIPAAYVCSKTRLPGHKVILWFFFLTMYISGGVVPGYLLIKNLGLLNNPLVLIITGGVNCYYMIVARQYFMTSIPQALYEASEIDGASEFRQFFSVSLPLAKPIIAVLGLYYAFDNWNGYYQALLYLKDQKYWPLQLVLRQILIKNTNAISNIPQGNTAMANDLVRQLYMVRGMKYAIILIASLPLLMIYPFFSKYFAKGVMIGSVKE